MSVARSYLFVPGDRPDRFAKAAASGADRIIIDLEDAVAPADKDRARQAAAEWFGAGGPGVVRVNGADTPWFEADLAAASAWPQAEVMTPKAEPRSIAEVAARLPGRALLALVETVAGLAHLRETAQTRGVARLAFGNVDFGADARIPAGGAVLDPARFQLALESRLAGLPPPVDGVTVELGDGAALEADVARARAMGFGAKLCIHPRQVGPANIGLAPTDEDIAWARRVVAALEAAGGSVVQVDGKMVDRPVIDRARSILEEAWMAS